ncbi:MAG: nucleotide exchange factor GrpE [Gammaproteobacteria bacterium]
MSQEDQTARPADPAAQPPDDGPALAALRAELDAAKAKAEENWALHVGARAEIDNIRKRAERDLANAHKFALERFVGELLPVKDSLEMGINAAVEAASLAKIREGSELTLKMLSTALDKAGVKEIDPLGQKFNPDLHHAIAMQPAASAEPNTVVQVIQKGYALNERLVRPALVIVAQVAPKETQSSH